MFGWWVWDESSRVSKGCLPLGDMLSPTRVVTYERNAYINPYILHLGTKTISCCLNQDLQDLWIIRILFVEFLISPQSYTSYNPDNPVSYNVAEWVESFLRNIV